MSRDYLARARAAAGLTQYDLAVVAGVSQTVICNLERGRTGYALLEVHAALGLPPPATGAVATRAIRARHHRRQETALERSARRGDA